jgi:hypothetical protein
VVGTGVDALLVLVDVAAAAVAPTEIAAGIAKPTVAPAVPVAATAAPVAAWPPAAAPAAAGACATVVDAAPDTAGAGAWAIAELAAAMADNKITRRMKISPKVWTRLLLNPGKVFSKSLLYRLLTAVNVTLCRLHDPWQV